MLRVLSLFIKSARKSKHNRMGIRLNNLVRSLPKDIGGTPLEPALSESQLHITVVNTPIGAPNLNFLPSRSLCSFCFHPAQANESGFRLSLQTMAQHYDCAHGGVKREIERMPIHLSSTLLTFQTDLFGASSRRLLRLWAMKFRWSIAPPQPLLAGQLANHLKISPLLAQCLLNRGLSEPDGIGVFLQPRLKQLADPFLLPNMT